MFGKNFQTTLPRRSGSSFERRGDVHHRDCGVHSCQQQEAHNPKLLLGMAYRRRSLQLLQQLVRAAEAQPSCVTAERLAVQNEVTSLRTTFSRSISTSTARLADAQSPSATAQGPPYALVGGALVATGGLIYLLFGGNGPSVPPAIGVQSSEAEPSNDGSGVGAHQIGHYEVETHKGDKMTPDELHGDFALMYFGTTDHADTVSELERLAEIVGYSDKLSNMHYLNPVFVTVRPDKDDRQKMDNVVSLFDTNHNRMGMRLLGVTGAETQKLHESALKFGNRTQKPVDQPDTTFFFIDPEGTFVQAYSGLTDAKEIAEDMAGFIKKYKLSHPMWHGPKKIAKRHA